MNRSSKTAIAAAAIALSGGAHAALELFGTQNSSLAFIAMDNVGSPISYMADLGFRLNDVLPATAFNAPNTTIQWNFASNTLTVNGVVQTAETNAWSSPFATFMATAQSSDLRWAVIGGDDLEGARYVTTGIASQANLANTGASTQTLGFSANMAKPNTLYLVGNNSGTNTSADNGAFTATSGDGYVGNSNSFGVNGTWGGGLRWNAFAADGAKTLFSYINVQPRPGATTLSQITTYGLPSLDAPLRMVGVNDPSASTFMFDSASATLTWVSPIPEPGTYAMLLAGLLTVGFVAHRRRS